MTHWSDSLGSHFYLLFHAGYEHTLFDQEPRIVGQCDRRSAGGKLFVELADGASGRGDSVDYGAWSVRQAAHRWCDSGGDSRRERGCRISRVLCAAKPLLQDDGRAASCDSRRVSSDYAPDSASACMHGFVNFFLAAAAAYDGAGQADVASILSDGNPVGFHAAAGELRCRERSFSGESIETMRQQFAISFGSCSFEEPIGEMRPMRWIE